MAALGRLMTAMSGPSAGPAVPDALSAAAELVNMELDRPGSVPRDALERALSMALGPVDHGRPLPGVAAAAPPPRPSTGAAAERVDPALGYDVAGMLPPVAAYRAGRDMIGPGIAEGRPGLAALGVVSAVPMPISGRGRLMTAMTGGPAARPRPVQQGDRPFLAGWNTGPVRRALDRTRLPGTEPPGGPLPYLAGGGLAGGLAGYEASDGDPLATLGGVLGGGGATYMGARGIDRGGDWLARRLPERLRPPSAPGPTNIPPTGVGRDAARFTRDMPTTGRAPTGGGAFASYDEQRRAVDYFMSQGHRPPRPTWSEAAPGYDQYVRDALAAYRARRP